MGHDTVRGIKLTIGLDLGDRYSHLCAMDDLGEVVEEGRVATTEEAFHRRFSSYDPARVAIEVGTHSPWVSRLLEGCGHEVLVANPRKLRMIYKNDNKNDRVDAEWLARVARLDPKLLAPIRHRGAKAQTDLALLRARDELVRSRTQHVNHVRGAVKSSGGRLLKCSTESFLKKSTAVIPEALRPALCPVLEMIGTLNAAIRGYDRSIEVMARDHYPKSRVLQQVPGVGALTAVAYMLILEDPHRFKKSRSVGAFLGLRPRKSQSSSKIPSCGLPRREMPCCDDSSSAVPTTSWDRSGRTAICDVTVWRSQNGVGGTRRNVLWLQWRASLRCFYTDCGSPERSMSRSAACGRRQRSLPSRVGDDPRTPPLDCPVQVTARLLTGSRHAGKSEMSLQRLSRSDTSVHRARRPELNRVRMEVWQNERWPEPPRRLDRIGLLMEVNYGEPNQGESG